MTSLTETIIFATIGGIFPAILWLWFWLKEDNAHPEPSKLILKTFLYGILAVPVALVIQLIINKIVLSGISVETVLQSNVLLGILAIVLWSGAEEIVKYVAAYNGGLKRRANDEPVDVLIYLITAALGFAALENALFLIAPLLTGDTDTAFITGNMRFVGATLLHIATSAVIGIFVAFSYFYKQKIKKRYLWSGFILSIGLHSLFNLFIISYQDSIFLIFSFVWILIIGIILLFERIKAIHLNKIK